MKALNETTLRRSVALEGVGVHSGANVCVTLHPADAGTGIVFLRSDRDSTPIAANATQVTDSSLCTVLGNIQHDGIGTIEHLMAALYGLGVDNCLVEVDGPEVPILDGSSAPFVEAIDSVGISTLNRTRSVLRVLKTVRVTEGDSHAMIRPCAGECRVDTAIDFANPLIGRQSFAMTLRADTFRTHVARARTFGFMRDVDRLWSMGRALGASLNNTVVVGDGRIMNPEGLRFSDEFARHKLLDAVGDLSLAGKPVFGAFSSYKGSHALNVRLVRALLADPSAYSISPTGTWQDGAQNNALLAAAAYSPNHS